MNSKTFLVAAALAIGPALLTGCLDTRSSQREVEEKQVLRQQVSSLQQTTADVNLRFQDLEEGQRRLNGRIDGLNNRLEQLLAQAGRGNTQLETKFNESNNAYREEFTRLSGELEQVKAQLVALQDSQKRAEQARAEADAKAASAAAAAAKDPFQVAEDKFEQKNFQEAILEYERYRKSNPKGKKFAAATYKIGVAFQELGLAEDARAFYDEVIAKYPKAPEAGKAKTKLKSLKK